MTLEMEWLSEKRRQSQEGQGGGAALSPVLLLASRVDLRTKDGGEEDITSEVDLPLLSCAVLGKHLQLSAPICSSLNRE